MAFTQRLTKEQQKQVDAERARYNLAKKKAAERGEEFDPLDEAPTYDGKETNDPVKKIIFDIWNGKDPQGR